MEYHIFHQLFTAFTSIRPQRTHKCSYDSTTFRRKKQHSSAKIIYFIKFSQAACAFFVIDNNKKFAIKRMNPAEALSAGSLYTNQHNKRLLMFPPNYKMEILYCSSHRLICSIYAIICGRCINWPYHGQPSLTSNKSANFCLRTNAKIGASFLSSRYLISASTKAKYLGE